MPEEADEPVEIIVRTLRYTTVGTACGEPAIYNFAHLIVAALTEADWTIVPAWDEIDADRFRMWESMSPGNAAATGAWLEGLVGSTEGPVRTYVQSVRRRLHDGRLEVDVFVDVDAGDPATETRTFTDVTPPAWPPPSV